MRSIDRRIRRLENRFDPPENEAAWRLVTTLIERRQRRAEASGEPFEDPRERSRFPIDHRPRTIAEVLRQARQRGRLDRFDECSNQAEPR